MTTQSQIWMDQSAFKTVSILIQALKNYDKLNLTGNKFSAQMNNPKSPIQLILILSKFGLWRDKWHHGNCLINYNKPEESKNIMTYYVHDLVFGFQTESQFCWFSICGWNQNTGFTGLACACQKAQWPCLTWQEAKVRDLDARKSLKNNFSLGISRSANKFDSNSTLFSTAKFWLTSINLVN